MVRIDRRITPTITALLVLASGARGGDWPSWRGPSQNGVSLEKGLPDSTKQLLWRAHFGGRSTPAIFAGRVFGIDLAGKGVTEQDRVFAVDLATGKTLWQYRFNCFHTDVPDSRVGWASVAVDPETGNVYANGVQGMFLCLDRDGKLLWSKSLDRALRPLSGFGGRTYTPIIDEDRVIVTFNNSSFGSHAVGAHRFLALDKRTGEILWWSTPGRQAGRHHLLHPRRGRDQRPAIDHRRQRRRRDLRHQGPHRREGLGLPAQPAGDERLGGRRRLSGLRLAQRRELRLHGHGPRGVRSTAAARATSPRPTRSGGPTASTPATPRPCCTPAGCT